MKLQKDSFLDFDHWRKEDYRQRATAAQWRNILLEHRDTIIFRGTTRKLIAHNLGYGVVEIHKAALGEEVQDG